MEISVPNRIQIAIWENISPRFVVKISNSLEMVPISKPKHSVENGFSIFFLICDILHIPILVKTYFVVTCFPSASISSDNPLSNRKPRQHRTNKLNYSLFLIFAPLYCSFRSRNKVHNRRYHQALVHRNSSSSTYAAFSLFPQEHKPVKKAIRQILFSLLLSYRFRKLPFSKSSNP